MYPDYVPENTLDDNTPYGADDINDNIDNASYYDDNNANNDSNHINDNNDYNDNSYDNYNNDQATTAFQTMHLVKVCQC